MRNLLSNRTQKIHNDTPLTTYRNIKQEMSQPHYLMGVCANMFNRDSNPNSDNFFFYFFFFFVSFGENLNNFFPSLFFFSCEV